MRDRERDVTKKSKHEWGEEDRQGTTKERREHKGERRERKKHRNRDSREGEGEGNKNKIHQNVRFCVRVLSGFGSDIFRRLMQEGTKTM